MLVQLQRRFFSLASLVKKPDMRQATVIKEDIRKVMEELPAFNFYELESRKSEYPYKDVTMDEAILKPEPSEPQASNTRFTELDNGFRIVTSDRLGASTQLGLYVKSGSRQESPDMSGVHHMLSLGAFHSTGQLTYLRTIKTLEQLGASATATAAREDLSYSVEVLREFAPLAIPLILGNVLQPRFLPWEIAPLAKKAQMAHEALNQNADAAVFEMLHQAAWHNNTLGNPLYASHKTAGNVSPEVMREQLLRSAYPKNMVFSAINMDHDEAVKWISRSFADITTIPNPEQPRDIVKPFYTGGYKQLDLASPYVHIAVAFPTNGYEDKNFLSLLLLQTLLGGGGSFSTGGPGKGMHTRLYSEVMVNNAFIDGISAFNTLYSDAGLFGIYITVPPALATHGLNVLGQQLQKVSTWSESELERGRNSLRQQCFMSLESKAVAVEDLGRQLLHNGAVLEPKQFNAAVSKLTLKDIEQAVKGIFGAKPTITAYGDCAYIPHYDEILNLLKSPM